MVPAANVLGEIVWQVPCRRFQNPLSTWLFMLSLLSSLLSGDVVDVAVLRTISNDRVIDWHCVVVDIAVVIVASSSSRHAAGSGWLYLTQLGCLKADRWTAG